MTDTTKTVNKVNGYIVPLAIIGILFFVIGFGVGISGILIPFLQNAFSLTTSQSYLVTAAIFSAFVIFGAPSGLLVKKLGYKHTMLIAFFVMAAGMVLFVPSAHFKSFPFFLLALFIGGVGNTILQAAVNPYVTIIGPPQSAAMRICLMGIMNKAAWWIGPLFLGMFLDIHNAKLEDVTLPFYLVAFILVALGIFIYFAPLPEVRATGEDEETDDTAQSITGTKTSILQFPHLLLGILALFVYVGVETLPMASMLDFARSVYPQSDLTGYAKFVPIGLVTGYITGILTIPKILSQTVALKLVTILGLTFSAMLIFLPGSIGIYSLGLIGFANSLIWPSIWPLAIADLGKFTKTGASLLVTGIVGGGVIPLIFGVLADNFKGANPLSSTQNFQNAYWIFIPCYLYLIYYAFAGHKIRR